MKGFIYKVIRKSDGAIYIGKQSKWQTKDPSLSPLDIMGVRYFTSSNLIKDDWKANPDAYSFEVLEENITDASVLAATEVLWITKAWEDEKNGGPAVLNQYCNERFHRKGPVSFSEEHKKRLSEAAKRRDPLPEEVREKIRKTLTGRHSTDEARANQSKALKGKPWTEEHRRKAMESLRKVWDSDEYRQKRRELSLGKHHTEETKKKISEIAKKQHRSGGRFAKRNEDETKEDEE